MKLILHPSGIFSWGPVSPVGLKVWFFFILVFICLLMFYVLGFHYLSQFFILTSQLFHISQKGLNLLLLHNFLLLCSFCFHLVLRGTFLSLRKMAWMISVPINGAKLIVQKISSWAPRRSGWTKLWLRSSLLEENLQNELGGRVTSRCGVSQTAFDA